MKFRVAKSSPCRLTLVVAGLVGCLSVSSVGQPAGSAMVPWVEDDASLLGERVRLELARELEAYNEATDCWIQVKTTPQAIGRKQQAQVFGRVWADWNYPKCAVVFFFIRETTSARMVTSLATGSRLTEAERGAILHGVVVPRFSADDPEGAVVAGVHSLRAALEGELEELPGPFRPHGSDRAVGISLIVLAVVALSGAAFQFVVAIKEESTIWRIRP